MVTMTSLEGQAWFRIANHLAGNPILSEPTLKRDAEFLTERAGVAVGVKVDVNIANVLHTLSLAVATGAEVPYATAAVSNFGGVA